MTDTELLMLLQQDLGEINAPSSRLEFLQAKIDSAKEYIETEGITLTEPFSNSDGMLIVSYASFLIKKRNTQEGIPRYLRWQLNNRVMKEKGNAN